MQPALIPHQAIIVGERFRTDLGDVEGLAQSIIDCGGLIQPIVVDKNRNLVAGGRRMAALALLISRGQFNKMEVPVVLAPGDNISEFDLRLMEYEENFKRKEMTWKEQVKMIANIHRLHQLRSLEGSGRAGLWGQRETANVLGVSQVNVSYALRVADALADPKSIVHQADGIMQALQLLTSQKEKEAEALAAKFSMVTTSAPQGGSIELPIMEDPTLKITNEMLQMVEPQIVDPAEERPLLRPLTIPLSQMLFNMNCLKFMTESEPEVFDGIMTDPPYAIDMDNLEQSSGHMDVSTVRDTHDVKDNMELLRKALPLMYKVLKNNTYCVLWCDQVVWQFLYDLAQEAGFRVQRWPLVWVKVHQCKNEAAAYNFTKATEIAMVLAKGSPTLIKPQLTNYFSASNKEVRDIFPNHPFVKPFELWEWIIDACFQPRSKIYDPFGGAGSAVLPLFKKGFVPIATELSQEHYNVQINTIVRWYHSIYPGRQLSFS
jgi:ParB family chromosome partitioning protein